MRLDHPSSSRLALFSAIAAVATLSPLAASAQKYLGSIQGTLTDSTGASVPDATVTAEEVSTHFKTEGKSNGTGLYTFAGLNPGTYTITTTTGNFRSETRTGVILTAGQLQKVDFTLNPGSASESVEVSADNLLLDTGSAQIATTISDKEVTDLPNVGRNPFVLATLGAGIINTGSGGYFLGKSSQFTQPFSGVAVQITADGSGGHNRLTLNGIPDDPPERFSGASYTGFVPSPEAVQEVKVQTSIFDAQVGHGNGTVTNTVVRSGANRVHGAAYYVFQNTYLNANTSEKAAFQSTGAVAYRRNNDQLSQTGFVFDGPVYIPRVYDGRDKTFFMVAYERYQSHTAINYSARVPTAAELNGDFSGLCSAFSSAGLCTSGVQIYDPQSPLDSNGNRTAYFANNQIPTSRFSATGQALLGYLPAPNVPGATATTNPNYVSTATSYPSTNPALIARLDHAIGSGQKDKLSAIFFRNGLSQNYPLQGFPKGIGPGGYGYTVYRNNRGGSLDEVHQFSPSFILDSRFGLVFHPFGLTYPGNGGVNLSSLGITTSGLPYASFPGTTETDGYATLASGAGGQISESTTGSLEEVVTKTLGQHTLRIGFEGNLLRYNVQNPQSGFGTYSFSRQFTQRNYNTGDAGSGDPVAAELLGAFGTASYNISAAYALQQIYAAPFVQDDWRVTSRLTLNLGLRYDYESPLTERYNKQVSGFAFNTPNPLQSSVTGLTLNGGLLYTSPGNRYPYPKDLNNFQPRVGAAYQVFPTTVLRAGFGIIYFNTIETPIGTGFSQATSVTNAVSLSSATPIYSMSNPFPNGVALPTGNSLGLATGLGTNISFIDPNHVTPKSAQYSLSVQQQFPGNLALQVAYIGTRPTRLEVNRNINVLPSQYYNQGGAEVNYLNTAIPNPLYGKISGSTSNLNTQASIARAYLLLPYPQFGTVTEQYSSIGSAPYNALQIQITRPMKNHFSLQGNFTWDKLMLRNGFYGNGSGQVGDNASIAGGYLYSVQDSNPTEFGNIFGVFQLPLLLKRPGYERLALGGWQVNTVMRFSNGPLVSAPSNVDIVGNYSSVGDGFYKVFNPCYQTSSVNGTTGAVTVANALTKYDATGAYKTVTACDNAASTPAFRQRVAYTSQQNSNVLGLRYGIHPLVDLSAFKQFILHEGVSFEIRGEFFNVLNTPNFGAPNTTLGAANTASRAGSGSLVTPNGVATQANDARIGQLTARINF